MGHPKGMKGVLKGWPPGAATIKERAEGAREKKTKKIKKTAVGVPGAHVDGRQGRPQAVDGPKGSWLAPRAPGPRRA